MSDRSGVGAPTHDGAEPEKSGSGEPADDGSDAPRRRRAAGLLEAAFGADAPAGRRPPGVPAAPSTDDDGPRSNAASATKASAKKAPAKKAPASKAPASKKAPAEKRASAEESAPAVTKAAPATKAPRRAAADPSSPRAAATAATPVVDQPRRAEPAALAAEERPKAPRDRAPRRGPLRARQVHRIIRRVDPWSMLKLSLVFYFCVWLMVMISGVLIWGVAVGSGTVEGVEGFIARLLAFEEFRFNADQIFRLFAMGGLILVFLATAVSAILAVLFNLISDLIGGIRVTVIEEETTRRVVREP